MMPIGYIISFSDARDVITEFIFDQVPVFVSINFLKQFLMFWKLLQTLHS